MRITLTFTVLFLLIGCSKSIDVSERERYWRAILIEHIPVGTAFERIESWSSQTKLELRYSEAENAFTGVIETIPLDGIVCKEWYILARVDLGPDKQAISTSVSSTGLCL